MFIHGSFGHLFGNLLFLWIFGNRIEHRFGSPLFLLFYLGTGLVAGGAHLATYAGSRTPVVGASGAISGIIGAYMLLYPLRRMRVAVWYYGIVSVPVFVFLGLWFLFQLMNGLATLPQSAAQTSGIAFWSHIGGFGAGLGGAALLGRLRPEPVRARVAFAIWRDRDET
jgi:membrane associated rhomboid family serine protease